MTEMARDFCKGKRGEVKGHEVRVRTGRGQPRPKNSQESPGFVLFQETRVCRRRLPTAVVTTEKRASRCWELTKRRGIRGSKAPSSRWGG